MTEEDLDDVEVRYIRAINSASDPDLAWDLTVGLQQYRDMFKNPRLS